MEERQPFINPFRRPWMAQNGAADPAEMPLVKGMLAGAVTGAIETIITYPAEFIKTQLQLQQTKLGSKQYSGMIDSVQQTVRRRGILGLYRGLTPLIGGALPKSAARFGAFEYFKSIVADERGTLTHRQIVVCGFGSGVCEAILAVTPMESIKVKFISDQRSKNPRFQGVSHGIRLIAREHGVRGLYHGLIATALRQGSNQAIRISVVEVCKANYQKYNGPTQVPTFLLGIFGTIAGAVSVCCNNPVDVVKTRLQSFDADRYKGTMDCFKQILRNEGPRAFYSGSLPRLLRVSLEVAITLMVYDTLIERLNKIWR